MQLSLLESDKFKPYLKQYYHIQNEIKWNYIIWIVKSPRILHLLVIPIHQHLKYVHALRGKGLVISIWAHLIDGL